MAELGISLGTASIGAHVNNILFGRGQKTAYYDFCPGPYGSPGLFDAASDQRAIDAGHRSSLRHDQIVKRMISSWPTFNPK